MKYYIDEKPVTKKEFEAYSLKQTKPKKTSWINKWICNHFGHKYNWIQLMMMKIEMEARCLGSDIKPSLTCQRCGKVLSLAELKKKGNK